MESACLFDWLLTFAGARRMQGRSDVTNGRKYIEYSDLNLNFKLSALLFSSRTLFVTSSRPIHSFHQRWLPRTSHFPGSLLSRVISANFHLKDELDMHDQHHLIQKLIPIKGRLLKIILFRWIKKITLGSDLVSNDDTKWSSCLVPGKRIIGLANC